MLAEESLKSGKMKPGDLVMKKCELDMSSTTTWGVDFDSGYGLVVQTRKLKPSTKLMSTKHYPLGKPPLETNIVTVRFINTNLTHCFPEYFLELISEA